ncbi:MAG: hypothetical protein U0838_16730 [Chloroflexota bacterium]
MPHRPRCPARSSAAGRSRSRGRARGRAVRDRPRHESDLDAAFAAELAEAGAAVLLLGPTGRSAMALATLPIPAVSPLLAPAVSICTLQLLARQLARSRGRAPDLRLRRQGDHP